MRLEVRPANSDWPQQFAAQAAALHSTLGALLHKLAHIGSTAVPELAAKPVIDMLLVTHSLASLDQACQHFASLGYEPMGEYGIAGRRYFQKYSGPEAFHLHAFEIGDANIPRYLAFRDYLKAFPQVGQEYAALKIQLALACNRDRLAYAQGKNQFVSFHEAQALQWWRQAQ